MTSNLDELERTDEVGEARGESRGEVVGSTASNSTSSTLSEQESKSQSESSLLDEFPTYFCTKAHTFYPTGHPLKNWLNPIRLLFAWARSASDTSDEYTLKYQVPEIIHPGKKE